MSTIYTIIDANVGEEENMLKLFKNFLEITHPGKTVDLSVSDITFSTPTPYTPPGGGQIAWSEYRSISKLNQNLVPNTQVDVSITKEEYRGVVPSKLYYHRYDLRKASHLKYKNEEDFFSGDTNGWSNNNITIDNSGVSSFANYFKNAMKVVDGSVTYGFYDDTTNSAKYFTVKVNSNSLLYLPDSSLSIKGSGASTLPFVTEHKQ